MSIYKDKRVLITGASTGLGYALAEELNKRGAEVILTARSENKLHALAEKIKASGGKAHVFVEDLSIQGSAEALYSKIKSQNLSVDILINNAGVLLTGNLFVANSSTISEKDLKDTFQTNFFSVISLTQKLLPLIKKSSAGRIVNVSTILSSLTLHSAKDSPISPAK